MNPLLGRRIAPRVPFARVGLLALSVLLLGPPSADTRAQAEGEFRLLVPAVVRDADRCTPELTYVEALRSAGLAFNTATLDLALALEAWASLPDEAHHATVIDKANVAISAADALVAPVPLLEWQTYDAASDQVASTYRLGFTQLRDAFVLYDDLLFAQAITTLEHADAMTGAVPSPPTTSCFEDPAHTELQVGSSGIVEPGRALAEQHALARSRD